MEKKEKKYSLTRNIAIGVAVGAAVTLFKKENRDKLVDNVQKAKDTVKDKVNDIRENKIQIKDRVREVVEDIRTKGSKLTDKAVITDKLETLKKLTPLVIETWQESREIFNKKKQELKEKEEEEAYLKQQVITPAEGEAAATAIEEESHPKTEEVVAEKTVGRTSDELIAGTDEKTENKQSV